MMPYRAWIVTGPAESVLGMSDRSGVIDPRLRKFGARLRHLREGRGLTMEQLAERAQVGVRQIARVEAGRGSPSVLWLIDVAAGLQADPGELLRQDL